MGGPSVVAVPSDLSVRARVPELMDESGLERDRHVHALQALARVNLVSMAAGRVWADTMRIYRRTGSRVRVLDLACGGGDVLRRVGRRAARAGIPVELLGCDSSSVALESTAARCAGLPVETSVLDVVHDEVPRGFDLVTTSLFLHHLSEGDAVGLLAKMAEATERSILVQDLRRTRLGYLFAWIGLHTLTTSDVARIDGLRSVRAAFTMSEASALCAAASIPDARVDRVWPQRFVIRWSRA